MKTFMKLILCATMLLAMGCDKGTDKGDEKEGVVNAISGKWDISTTPSYVSIEFNKSGNYIVVKNRPNRALANDFEVVFGEYKVTSKTSVKLIDFGDITIKSLTSNDISLSLTLPGNMTPINLEGDKSEEMAVSTKTQMLCRTWDLVKLTDNGVVVDNIDQQTLYFSTAGTYLINNSEGASLSNWKWYDSNQNKFYYSWNFPPTWVESGEEGSGTAQITALTANKLVVASSALTWEFKPSAISRSVAVVTTTTTDNQRKGFWGE